MTFVIAILLIPTIFYLLKIATSLDAILKLLEIEEVKLPALIKGAAIFKRKKRGAIYFPKTDLDVAREEIIQKNKEAGIDTPVNDLIDEE